MEEKSLEILNMTNKVTDDAFTLISYFLELHRNRNITLTTEEITSINNWLTNYYGLATYVNKINNNSVVH